MDLIIEEGLRIMLSMVLESLPKKMGILMKVYGRIMLHMEKGSKYSQTEIAIKVNMLRVRRKERMECIDGTIITNT